MEDQRSQMGFRVETLLKKGRKSVQLLGCRDKGRRWIPVPGITRQELVSCGHVWQEVKPRKRLSCCCRLSQAEMGERGKELMTLSCLQIHWCFLLAALTLSLWQTNTKWAGVGRARSECKSKQPQDWQSPDTYLTLCFRSMPGVCSSQLSPRLQNIHCWSQLSKLPTLFSQTGNEFISVNQLNGLCDPDHQEINKRLSTSTCYGDHGRNKYE